MENLFAKFRDVFFYIFIAFLSGCAAASPPAPVMSKKTTVSFPELHKKTQIESGDTVISRRITHEIPAIELKERFEMPILSAVLAFPPQTITCTKIDEKYMYYNFNSAFKRNIRFGASKEFHAVKTDNRYALMVSRKKPDHIRLWSSGESTRITKKPDLTMFTSVDSSKPYFEHQLIYKGTTGNIIHFLYKKRASGHHDKTIERKVDHDLSRSHTLSFEGARIKFLDHNETNLTYVVQRGFPKIYFFK